MRRSGRGCKQKTRRQEASGSGCIGAMRTAETLVDGMDRPVYVVWLFRDLAANFAGLVRGGVDVDIHPAGEEIAGLRIGQRCGAFQRAGRR